MSNLNINGSLSIQSQIVNDFVLNVSKPSALSDYSCVKRTWKSGKIEYVGLCVTSSETRQGEFTITFDEPLANASYNVFLQVAKDNASYMGIISTVVEKTTTYFKLKWYGNGTNDKANKCSFLVIYEP